METKDNSTNQRYFIENNRNNPIIRDVLDKKTTIRKEIENFYNIGLGYALRGDDYIKKSNPEKSGKIPESLLDIIGPFSEQGELNSKFLDYEGVRGQIKIGNRYSMLSIPGIFASMGGVIGSMMGALAMANTDQFNYGNSEKVLIISAGVGLAGILSLIKLAKNSNKRWKTSENIEFCKLKNSVSNMDNFIRKYKIYEELK